MGGAAFRHFSGSEYALSAKQTAIPGKAGRHCEHKYGRQKTFPAGVE